MPTFKTEALKSLQALAVGDSTGENLMKILPALDKKAGNVVVAGVAWPWTDDTARGIGITRVMLHYGTINQLALAKEFAESWWTDPNRGYGKGTAAMLQKLHMEGPDNWQHYSRNWWGENNGSKGNGAAMGVAPVGAFFGMDLRTVAAEAQKQAEVTHWHEESFAGAIAVAVAAAVATHGSLDDYWDAVLGMTPSGTVRDAITLISKPNMLSATNWQVVGAVGNGSKVLAIDSVPFVIWQAYQGLLSGDFEKTINSVVEVGGDTDTTAAMVAGIIGNRVRIPQEWIERTEPLPSDLQL